MKKTLRYYLAPNGKAPFAQWINKIKDHTTRSRIERRLERLVLWHYGDHKSVGEGIVELRLDFGPGYRVYFTEQEEIMVLLLCGGDKSTQTQDIEMAKSYWKELRGRRS